MVQIIASKCILHKTQYLKLQTCLHAWFDIGCSARCASLHNHCIYAFALMAAYLVKPLWTD